MERNSKLILFILLLLNHISYGHGYVGYNYDSQQGVNNTVGGIIVVTVLLFILYIIIKVRKELRNDRYGE
jgi:hypothetical protein